MTLASLKTLNYKLLKNTLNFERYRFKMIYRAGSVMSKGEAHVEASMKSAQRARKRFLVTKFDDSTKKHIVPEMEVYERTMLEE